VSWTAIIDTLGEPGTLAATGLLIGTAFGFLAQRSRFACVRRSSSSAATWWVAS